VSQEPEYIRKIREAQAGRQAKAPAESGRAELLSLEGIADRDTLKERVKPGATVGEEVLGVYEIKGGRPVTVELQEGQVTLKMGAPRPGANPMSPEKMLRKAAAEAAIRAKQRPRDDDRDRRRR
jgi:hypothetical protein